MATGKVIRFDAVRGYGFVAPDGGGEDLFLHVNDLLVDKSLIAPGVTVEFTSDEGERGMKASDVRVIGRRPYSDGPAERGEGDEAGDVLTREEFREEVTEALLGEFPELTAAQIVGIRKRMIALASAHGWVEH